MKYYTISQLARAFGLSRSTLLYYDRINLLKAPERTAAGYRCYTKREYRRLERICMFRNAGMHLNDIRQLLTDGKPSVRLLEKRLYELQQGILLLRNQQHMIIDMLKNISGKTYAPVMDKAMWVQLLASAGMDEAAMALWHTEFERCAPDAHHEFLLSLGISESEVQQIRTWSKDNNDRIP